MTYGVQERNVRWYRSLPVMPITLAEMSQLPEYSATNPTGVIPGKMWTRHNGAFDERFKHAGGVPFWVICRYEDAPAQLDPRSGEMREMCKTVTYRPMVRVKAFSVRT